jgi:hypothetical protein
MGERLSFCFGDLEFSFPSIEFIHIMDGKSVWSKFFESAILTEGAKFSDYYD